MATKKIVICDYCGEPAELVSGWAVYPHRPDLAEKLFWQCAPCGAYVGCHEPGATYYENGRRKTYADGVPLGRLANAELRKAKKRAHAAFDPTWKAARMSRREAYAWLSAKMNIPIAACHIGMFTPDQCRQVVSICTQENAK